MTVIETNDFAFIARLPEMITTRRLILRAPAPGDVPALARLANNGKIYKWLARLPHPYTRQDAIDFVENIARSETEHAYAILSTDGDLLGIIGLHLRTDDGVELGYWIGEPFWGEGYASEATGALVEAVHRADGPRLHARVQSANTASRRVLEKAGFIEIDEHIDNCGPHKGVPIVLYREARRR